MSELIEFAGCVHMISPLQRGEFSLCGIAFDAHSSEDDPTLEFKPSTKKTVTCKVCSSVIEACRGVKTLKTTPKET